MINVMVYIGLGTPETVPFRLTRDIMDGMGITGCEGIKQLLSIYILYITIYIILYITIYILLYIYITSYIFITND